MSNSNPSRPKSAPHLAYSAARHVLGKMPQWAARVQGVATMHRVHPPLQRAACRVVCPVASPTPSCSESRAPELPLALSGAPSRTPSPSSALLPWASWPWSPLTLSEAHAAAAALGVAPSPPLLWCLGTARLRHHNPSRAGPLVSRSAVAKSCYIAVPVLGPP